MGSFVVRTNSCVTVQISHGVEKYRLSGDKGGVKVLKIISCGNNLCRVWGELIHCSCQKNKIKTTFGVEPIFRQTSIRRNTALYRATLKCSETYMEDVQYSD